MTRERHTICMLYVPYVNIRDTWMVVIRESTCKNLPFQYQDSCYILPHFRYQPCYSQLDGNTADPDELLSGITLVFVLYLSPRA